MSSFPKELRVPLYSRLHKEDTEEQTYGCRHSNPDICKYCYVDEVCAFVSKDSICKNPSRKWKRVYKDFKENRD